MEKIIGFLSIFGIFGFSFLMPFLLTKIFVFLKIKRVFLLYPLSALMANSIIIWILVYRWITYTPHPSGCGMDGLMYAFLIMIMPVNVAIAILYQHYLSKSHFQTPHYNALLESKIGQIGNSDAT